eukprot:TRINITY_DN41369_c0_g1_i1.p1 TRINITY_DN41369_c0_g1~~TRINITY_DN41369_c0_g1_i1.p1  ORF type:complete len:428 (-),score=54.53 TRINITY_DN41369_c0_g1_i1:105-1274(-)
MGASVCCVCRAQRDMPLLYVSRNCSERMFYVQKKTCALLSEPLDLSCITMSVYAGLYPTAGPSEPMPIDREVIPGKPGRPKETLAVDWIGETRAGPPKSIVLMFPGVGTTSKVGFTAMVGHHLAKVMPDTAVCMAVLQGHDFLPLKSLDAICTGYVTKGDAGLIISHVGKKWRHVPIVVVACSIGTAHFTYWATRNPVQVKRSSVVGGIMLCHGYSAKLSAEAVDAFPAAASAILGCFRENLAQSPLDEALLEERIPDHKDQLQADLETARTLEEWDTALLPLYGYKSREEMLDAAELREEGLRNLMLPIVFINADDDPLCPATRLIDEARIHEIVPNCLAVRTARGSHMAWWDGPVWANEQKWACNLIHDTVVAMTDKEVTYEVPPEK